MFIDFAASNILLARLATRSAKPNGQFYLDSRDVTDFMAKQSVKDLPGILCFRDFFTISRGQLNNTDLSGILCFCDFLQFLENSFKHSTDLPSIFCFHDFLNCLEDS